jgi:hypothetical protein
VVREKKLDLAEVERIAAQAIANAPHVARVYTREQLLLGEVSGDRFSERVVRSYNARRSGDLEVLLEPYWVRSATGANHGAPFSYDSHIPLIFMGSKGPLRAPRGAQRSGAVPGDDVERGDAERIGRPNAYEMMAAPETCEGTNQTYLTIPPPSERIPYAVAPG